jgi:hypothetical protein
MLDEGKKGSEFHDWPHDPRREELG